jgi:hypothetical protein
VLGQIRGTSTFSILLSPHTIMLASSLFQIYLIVTYEHIALSLGKKYAAIAAASRKL